MSISSTATSYSHSISEADSGVDFETPSKKMGLAKTVVESLPKLDARKGVGLRATPVETPTKRTKRTDKSKLLRTVSLIKSTLKKGSLKLACEMHLQKL